MRIRTVKPEFWSDEKLARLSEPALLLALGLLNYADDHGYFNANEALIRAAVFPLREPTLSVARMLSELADIGYIRVGNARDGRRIGIVVHFGDHQKVSHPLASKLRHLVVFAGIVDDANVPTGEGRPVERPSEPSGKLPEASGSFHEASGLKGTGNREQGTGNREGPGAGGAGDILAPAHEDSTSTDDDRIGWLKRKRAWVKEPSDRAAWLGMLREFGPKQVDLAIEHLRRSNPAKKYVDAGDAQSLIELGMQAVAASHTTPAQDEQVAAERLVAAHGWERCRAWAGLPEHAVRTPSGMVQAILASQDIADAVVIGAQRERSSASEAASAGAGP